MLSPSAGFANAEAEESRLKKINNRLVCQSLIMGIPIAMIVMNNPKQVQGDVQKGSTGFLES
jgi:hypothetical protein